MRILQTEIGTNEIYKVTCIFKKKTNKTNKTNNNTPPPNPKTQKLKGFKEVEHCKK